MRAGGGGWRVGCVGWGKRWLLSWEDVWRTANQLSERACARVWTGWFVGGVCGGGRAIVARWGVSFCCSVGRGVRRCEGG